MDYKDKIISELDTMRKKEIQDKQPFKARAYAKVISELKAHARDESHQPQSRMPLGGPAER